jgi:GNAT superfamily N-acetyltransferase
MSVPAVYTVYGGQELRDFIKFPFQLYKDDPFWVPPLIADLKTTLSRKKNPFFEHAEAEYFVAREGARPVGRVAAIIDHNYNKYHGKKIGWFGFFECIDDLEVAKGLFDAVGAWLAERGLRSVRGPTNPSLNYELGLLIDGFDSPPTFMMTYNPPYYARLIEGCGFRKTQDLYAFGGHVSILPKIREKLEPVAVQIIEHLGVKLRTLDRSRFQEDVEAFLNIYNRSLVDTWGFVPMSDAEVRYLARDLKHLIIPELAVGAEIDGQLVGAVFCLPDYNPRIKQINGRLFPFGFLRLLYHKERIKRIRVISTNVIPEYHRQGVGLVLMHGLVPHALKVGIEEAEFSWVLESNSLSRRSLEKGGAELQKTYRLYDWDPPSAPS